MGDVTRVIGLVAADEAEAIVADLLTHGLADDEVDVHPPEPGSYQLADEALHEDVKGFEHGAFLGAGIGLAIGLLAALAFADVGVITVLIGALGAAFGGMVGGLAGLATNDRMDDDPIEFREIGPGDETRVVEVHSQHWYRRAHRILERHGADFLASGEPTKG